MTRAHEERRNEPNHASRLETRSRRRQRTGGRMISMGHFSFSATGLAARPPLAHDDIDDQRNDHGKTDQIERFHAMAPSRLASPRFKVDDKDASSLMRSLCTARYAIAVATTNAVAAMAVKTNCTSTPPSQTSGGNVGPICHSGRPVSHQRV